MKRFLPILPFLFCACSADIDSQLPDLPLSSEAISLYSGIGSITAGQTRGDGIATLAADLPVAFVRTDKLSGGSYPSTYAELDTLEATIKTTGQVEFGRRQLYLANGGTTKFVGWYPQSGTWNDEAGTVTFTIDGTTDILASTTGEGSNQSLFSTTQHTLTFNHVLTQARVFIYADGTDSQAVWGNLTGVSLTGKAHTCTLTLPATDADEGTSPVASFTTTNATDLALQKLDNSGPAATSSASLTLGTTAPDTAEDAPIGYAMFAPHTGSGNEKLTLNVTTAKGGTQSVDIDYAETTADFRPGYIYNVVLKLTASRIVLAGITITPWNDGGTTNGGISSNDLPEGWDADIPWDEPMVFTGESNCYIVPPSGQVLIPISRAKAFADSAHGQDIDGEGTKMPVIEKGEEFYANVIWTDSTSTLTPVAATRKAENILYCAGTGPNGYILVKVGSAKGNAVVGLQKKTGESTYTTLWSWHIWVTDDPTVKTYTHTNTNGTFTFMDRNLGATSGTMPTVEGDASALGVLYQWGRKDPFPSSSTNAASTNRTLYGDGTTLPSTFTVLDNATSVGSTGISMANAIQYPWKFYYFTSTIDWCTDDKTTSTRWNSSTNTKTIYDPCPAGWRVPVTGAFTGFNTKHATTFPWTASPNFGRLHTSLGWWPAAGVRWGDHDAGKLANVGSYGYYWSATPHPNYAINAWYLSFYSSYVYPSSYGARAIGMAVRCVAEN